MKNTKLSLIFAFLLSILISCEFNKKPSFDFSYEESYQEFELKNVNYYPLPDICKPYLGRVVTLYDNKDIIFEDTLNTLEMIATLNCHFYHKYGNITSDEDSLTNLITNDYKYVSTIRRIEDVSKINNLLKNKYNIKREPIDSMEMENLIRLIVDTQFGREVDRKKHMYVNKRKSWKELLEKHNGINLSDPIILSSFRPNEIFSIKETRRIINNKSYNNNSQLLFCFNFTYDPKSGWSSYDEIIIRYELYFESEGYLQLKKHFENIFFLLKPSSVE